jgi:hypothetical protein
MEEDNRANVGNLDDYLMGFSTSKTTYDTHSPIQVACANYAGAVIVATGVMAAKHLTISSVIL